jgi:hypothetical protein
MAKEIDGPLKTNPPATRPSIRSRAAHDPSHLLGFMCHVGNLRWLRGERRTLGDHRARDDRPRDDHAEHDRRHHHDATGHDDHNSPHYGHDQRASDDGDDLSSDESDNAHHGQESDTDHGLHSPDDGTGHDDDGL